MIREFKSTYNPRTYSHGPDPDDEEDALRQRRGDGGKKKAAQQPAAAVVSAYRPDRPWNDFKKQRAAKAKAFQIKQEDLDYLKANTHYNEYEIRWGNVECKRNFCCCKSHRLSLGSGTRASAPTALRATWTSPRCLRSTR